MVAAENRIDQILAKGGLELNSQGDFNDMDNISSQSDLVPPSQSLANEMEPINDPFNSNTKFSEPFNSNTKISDLYSSNKKVDDIFAKVETMIIDDEIGTDHLQYMRSSNLSNDQFVHLRASNLSSDQF